MNMFCDSCKTRENFLSPKSATSKKMRRTAKSRGGTFTNLELEEIGEIGHGAFGTVLKMRAKDERRSSMMVAVKNPNPNSSIGLDIIEKDLLLSLNHKNVVNLLYYFIEGPTVGLVMELVEGGDLFEYLRLNFNRDKGIGILVELFAFQMFRGLAYIHGKNVAHRDIKPENLLVNEETGTLKIADFGLGTTMSDPEAPHAFYVGTRMFRPPELLLGCKRYSTKVDVWAGGVVLTQMLLGQPVFYEPSVRTTKDLVLCIFKHLGLPTDQEFEDMNVTKIALPENVTRKTFEDSFSDVQVRDENKLIDLLGKIFVYSPEERSAAWQVCDHEYFDILRDESTKLPNGNPLPKIFDFSEEETASMPTDVSKRLGSILQE